MAKPVFKVTAEGLQSLKHELEELLGRRPSVLTRMVTAREQGDLSENAGYHAAKEELGKIDSRVNELKYMIRFSVVAEEGNGETVSFGSSVRLDNGGKVIEFKIVSAQEADPAQGKISDSSPIGKSLIGRKVGDKINVETPAGMMEFDILGIS